MSKSVCEGRDSQFTPSPEVAVIACGEPNGRHSKEANLVAANCFFNGLNPHLFYFSPHTSRFLTNKKFLTHNGFPVTICGSTPQASFETIQKLGQFYTRTWIGIAPDVPETYDVTREGVLYLWRQKPERDIIYNNMPMEDVLMNWGFDHLKNVKLVVCQTVSEKILYPKDICVASEAETEATIRSLL